MTFDELGLAAPLLRAVQSEGYATTTPVQAEAIPQVLAGRDVMACAQTGTGKTAAFALPLLHRLAATDTSAKRSAARVRALVLAPTRELAAQIDESFAVYGQHTALKHVVVFGGVNQGPQSRALRRGVEIVTATPGRLLDLVNQGIADLGAVEFLVIDEADRMLDMGFLPDLRRLIAKLPRQRQTVMFSATMPEAMAELARSILHDPVRIRIAPAKATTELIEESVVYVPREKKKDVLANLLERASGLRAVVFTRTKHGADKLARHLNRSGIQADAIHGDKSQSARLRALAKFKSKKPPVLVATDVAARGIDVDGISHVFNYDLPLEPEVYVHRIGRTGRAGAAGVAISFCDRDELKLLKAIEQLMRRAIPRATNVEVVGAIEEPKYDPHMGRHAPRGPQTRTSRSGSGRKIRGPSRSRVRR